MTGIFQVYGESEELYQWDLNRRLTVSAECDQVHFAYATDVCATVCGLYEENGQRFVKVPNILLQRSGQLRVYAIRCGQPETYTAHAAVFYVKSKPKPADYVYTETEVLTYTALEARVNALEVREDAAIVCGATGENLLLTDSADRFIRGLVLYGKSNQTGTPAPGSPARIDNAGADGDIGVTAAGTNLFDASAAKSNSRIYTITGGTAGIANGQSASDYIAVAPNTAYTLNFSYYSGGDYGMAFYDANKAFISGQKQSHTNAPFSKDPFTFVTPENCAFVRFSTGTAAEIDIATISMNAGESVLPFEEYKAVKVFIPTPNGLPGIKVSGGGNYTDSTGQRWISDEKDFGRGVSVQRLQKYTFTGDEDISVYGAVNANGFGRMTVTIPAEPSSFIDNTTLVGMLCDRYTPRTAAQISTVINGGGTGYFCGFGENAVKIIFSTTNTVLADFRAEIAGTTIYYELAEPIETPLPGEEMARLAELRTNYPTTTLFNDEGAGMAVTYVADTKGYIDQKFTELAAAIVASA